MARAPAGLHRLRVLGVWGKDSTLAAARGPAVQSLTTLENVPSYMFPVPSFQKLCSFTSSREGMWAHRCPVPACFGCRVSGRI